MIDDSHFAIWHIMALCMIQIVTINFFCIFFEWKVSINFRYRHKKNYWFYFLFCKCGGGMRSCHCSAFDKLIDHVDSVLTWRIFPLHTPTSLLPSPPSISLWEERKEHKREIVSYFFPSTSKCQGSKCWVLVNINSRTDEMKNVR